MKKTLVLCGLLGILASETWGEVVWNFTKNLVGNKRSGTVSVGDIDFDVKNYNGRTIISLSNGKPIKFNDDLIINADDDIYFENEGFVSALSMSVNGKMVNNGSFVAQKNITFNRSALLNGITYVGNGCVGSDETDNPLRSIFDKKLTEGAKGLALPGFDFGLLDNNTVKCNGLLFCNNATVNNMNTTNNGMFITNLLDL